MVLNKIYGILPNSIPIFSIGILWLPFFLIQTSNGVLLLPIDASVDFGPAMSIENGNGQEGRNDLENIGIVDNAHFGQKRWSPMQNRQNKGRTASGARLDRLIGALFSPNFQRRRTRGIHHQPKQQIIGGVDQRQIRQQWRPAFHRTGGTILLGKRRGARATMTDDELWSRRGNNNDDLPPKLIGTNWLPSIRKLEMQIGKRRKQSEIEIPVDEENEEWPDDEEMLAMVHPKGIPGLVYG